VHTQIADVTKPADVTDLVAGAESTLGPITILVNNAGVGLFGPATRKPRPIGIAFSILISRAFSSSPAPWRLP